MAEFDPQAYLNDSNNTTSSFDPSAYLAQDQQVNSGFILKLILLAQGLYQCLQHQKFQKVVHLKLEVP